MTWRFLVGASLFWVYSIVGTQAVLEPEVGTADPCAKTAVLPGAGVSVQGSQERRADPGVARISKTKRRS